MPRPPPARDSVGCAPFTFSVLVLSLYMFPAIVSLRCRWCSTAAVVFHFCCGTPRPACSGCSCICDTVFAEFLCFHRRCHHRCRVLKTKFRFVFRVRFFCCTVTPFFLSLKCFHRRCHHLCFFSFPCTCAAADWSGNLVLYAIFVLYSHGCSPTP
jgi:hypothetical protein